MLVCRALAHDRPGLLGLLGSAVASAGGNVVEAASRADPGAGVFVARLVVEDGNLAVLRQRLDSWPGTVELTVWPPAPVRTAVLCSRPQHAAAAVLAAAVARQLPINPVALISDRAEPGALASRLQVPFHHLPVGPSPATREAQERDLAALLEQLDVELVILARYMRVLPLFVCEAWDQRMINIHHALLPAFPGSAPYRRAFERGVKVVGATAHYVTAELDAGPIIAQDTSAVSYLDGPRELEAKGADIESQVLISAVRAHLDRRVFVLDGRTIVLG